MAVAKANPPEIDFGIRLIKFEKLQPVFHPIDRTVIGC